MYDTLCTLASLERTTCSGGAPYTAEDVTRVAQLLDHGGPHHPHFVINRHAAQPTATTRHLARWLAGQGWALYSHKACQGVQLAAAVGVRVSLIDRCSPTMCTSRVLRVVGHSMTHKL
jgi:hypothetical protein